MAEYDWEEVDKRTNSWGRKRVRGSHCSKGHEFTPENTFIRAYDNARVCRECRKQYAREKYQRNKIKNNGVARPKKDKLASFEIPESAIQLDNALEPWYTLQRGLANTETKCQVKPTYYIDQPEDIDEDTAELMCHGCPLIKQCYDYAVASKQEWGVWGGVNFTTEEMKYEPND